MDSAPTFRAAPLSGTTLTVLDTGTTPTWTYNYATVTSGASHA